MTRRYERSKNEPKASSIRHSALCCALSATLVAGTCAAPLSAFADEEKAESEIAQQEPAQVEDSVAAIIAPDSDSSTLPDDADNEDSVGTDAPDADSVETSQEKETEDVESDADGQSTQFEDAEETASTSIDESSVTGSNITDDQIAEALHGLDGDASSSARSARSAVSTFALSGSNSAVTYGGATMYETAVSQAKAAYSSCSTVILAGPGEAWVDALAAAGLAGGLDCPILFTQTDYLHPSTKQALADLGVKNAIIVGGPLAVSDKVVGDLKAAGVSLKARLGGTDCYDTQMKIYEYGVENGLWSSGMAIVATGGHFGDTLSMSPVAFATKTPIFLSRNGGLDKAQKNALAAGAKDGSFREIVVAGGTLAVSGATGDYLSSLAQANGGSFKRLWGQAQYETSVAVAEWAVSEKGFSWNSAAFATGYEPYDALAGSVLQGKSRSVMLLVGDSSSATISAAASHKGSISSIRFFGGTIAIPTSIRNQIVGGLGMNTTYEETGISLSAMAKLEGVSTSDIDPSKVSSNSSKFYQFAVLDQGYSGKTTASQIDNFIAKNCVYQESNYGVTSTLRGMGSTIIAAAKKYNVNEVYLLSHAIIESAWGCSHLSTGRVDGYSGYYNFFGIGAYDVDPYNGGAALAKKHGWNTPAKAIEGAAQWISQNYLNNKYNQNTLYKMRWNYTQAANEGAVWHQYATAPTWATGIAGVMSNFYSYAGISQYDTGLKFLIPQYS